MSHRFVVTGTDTGVGKTVFSAGLANFLGADYWKPIQAGLEGETDSQLVARLGELSDDRIVPERYKLKTPASPHYAAEADGIWIDTDLLDAPDSARPLVIEGAGGIMVPLNSSTRYIDVFARWELPVVMCARTALGTINHSLLSIEALRSRSVDVLGIAFVGNENLDTESTICRVGRIRRLGRLPRLSPLSASTLKSAFRASFRRGDLAPVHAARTASMTKIVRGKGAHLYTADDRRIIDTISSWWVVTHGHCHPYIVSAIQEQAEKLNQIIFAIRPRRLLRCS